MDGEKCHVFKLSREREEDSNAERREKALRDVRGWKGKGLQEIDRHSLR